MNDAFEIGKKLGFEKAALSMDDIGTKLKELTGNKDVQRGVGGGLAGLLGGSLLGGHGITGALAGTAAGVGGGRLYDDLSEEDGSGLFGGDTAADEGLSTGGRTLIAGAAGLPIGAAVAYGLPAVRREYALAKLRARGPLGRDVDTLAEAVGKGSPLLRKLHKAFLR